MCNLLSHGMVSQSALLVPLDLPAIDWLSTGLLLSSLLSNLVDYPRRKVGIFALLNKARNLW